MGGRTASGSVAAAARAAAKRYWDCVPLVVYDGDEGHADGVGGGGDGVAAGPLREFYQAESLRDGLGRLPRAGGCAAERERQGSAPVLYSYGPGWDGRWASFDVECLKWQALLAFHGVQFETRSWNEPLLSPKGDLPLLLAGDRDVLVPPFATLRLPAEESSSVAARGGERRFGELVRQADDAVQDMAAFLALVETKLHVAVMYHLWCDSFNFSAVTEVAYGRSYAWPLSKLILWQRRSQVIDTLFAKRRTLIRDEIYEEAAEALRSLTERLGGDKYFSGTSTPSTLDAAVFAYIHTTMASPVPERELCNLVSRFPRLVEFSKLVYNTWFAKGSVGGW